MDIGDVIKHGPTDHCGRPIPDWIAFQNMRGGDIATTRRLFQRQAPPVCVDHLRPGIAHANVRAAVQVAYVLTQLVWMPEVICITKANEFSAGLGDPAIARA